MADESNLPKESAERPNRPKRRLKIGNANSETVRERSEKFQQEASVPQAPGKVRTFVGGFLWPIRALGRLLGRIFAPLLRYLGRFRALRFIGRWIGYILLPPYVRNSWRELRQVTWPNRRETFRLTYAVIIFSVIFGIIVFAVDSVLSKIFKELIVQ